MKNAAYLMIFMIMGIFFYGCQDGSTEAPENSTRLNKYLSIPLTTGELPSRLCGTTTYNLSADKTVNVGNLSVSNDEQYVYVTYNTSAPWTLLDVKLDISNAGPFTEKGSPGQYPYTSGALSNVNTFTFSILKSVADPDSNGTFSLRAYANVTDGPSVKGAFGGTIIIPARGSWFATCDFTMFTCLLAPKCYQYETAFAGNSEGAGKAWWFYFDALTTTQNIYAGQNILVGTATLSNGTLTINLTDGWELDDVSESVKIQGYETLPANRPAAGQFTTYKGDELSVNVGSYPYYVIHLDVRKEVPCP